MARYYSRDINYNCNCDSSSGGGGTGSWVPFGGGYSEVINSSGTYTVPAGATSIRVSCLGAGAAGANGTEDGNDPGNSAGFGGGGGGFSQKIIDSPSATYTVVVNSTVTSFGGLFQATAGVNKNGGIGSNGDYNYAGGVGEFLTYPEWRGGGGGAGILTFLSSIHTIPNANETIGGGAEVIGFSPHDYTPNSILDKNFYKSTTGGPLPAGYPGTGGTVGVAGGFAAGGGGGTYEVITRFDGGAGGISAGGGGGCNGSHRSNGGDGGAGMILVEW